MRFAKEGALYLLFFGGLSLISWALSPVVSLIFLSFFCFILFFFRDPERPIVLSETVFLSPADGRVLEIRKIAAGDFFKEPCVCVRIFLSIFDVHVNRAPMAGRIRDIRYRAGAFHMAFDKKAFEENENNLLIFDGPGFPFAVRQIAGKIARKIVCYCKIGERLEQGQRLGFIRFGSGCELYMPDTAEVQVSVGQKVAGGVSVIACLKK